MQSSVLATLKSSLRSLTAWYLKTPERALDEAYRAALKVKSLEDTHFGGGKISVDYGSYSKSQHALFQTELKEHLETAKLRLKEFNLSRSIVRLSNQKITEVLLEDPAVETPTISIIDQPALTLKKLKLVDEVLTRYNADDRYAIEKRGASTLVTVAEPTPLPLDLNGRRLNSPMDQARLNKQMEQASRAGSKVDSQGKVGSMSDKTGVLPRSILNTVDRIKRELDPEAEEEMVESFRNSKARTWLSIRFILLLIIIPLLIQQVSKYFLVGPVVEHFRGNEQVEVFLNPEMEEEALQELRAYEERIRFEVLIGKTPGLPQAEIEAKLSEKAKEIQEEYRSTSSDAVKNVFADLLGAVAFMIVLRNSKREVAIVKSFIDDVVYGLSDSAKAFIIILLTDTFVGFHSPHGWEVLLAGVARHFGLPENHDFIFLFIATFPVLLDTIFKYWIFRYLNRISPSAVATYRNMNE
jgi:hypothetical protein